MPPINVTTSLIASIGFIMVAVGFAPLLRIQLTPFAKHMVRGVLLISILLVMRSSYWDGAQYIAGEKWPALRSWLGGQAFSTVFNVPMFWAAYEFLKARHELIPDEERHKWRWYNAWYHPNSLRIPHWRARK